MRTWPRERGAMSRNATTVGLERMGYADPCGERKMGGEGEGGIAEAMRQNGHGILGLWNGFGGGAWKGIHGW